MFAPAQVHAVHESLTLEALPDRVYAAESAAGAKHGEPVVRSA